MDDGRMKFIKHFQERPRTVNLVALGPTNADYHGLHFRYDPVIPQTDQVWTVNKGFRTTKADLVFILDDLVGEARISKRYADEINKCQLPIITTIIDDEVAALYPDKQKDTFEYPIHDVLTFWGRAVCEIKKARGMISDYTEEDVRQNALRVAAYLKNSIPMILAYAGAIGVERINMFGVDYDFPGSTVHEADKPNAEYWVGQLHMIGVDVIVPDRTTLLSKNQGSAIYGYGKRQPVL